MGLPDLLETLKDFIQDDLKELQFKVKQEEWASSVPLERAIRVYTHMTPTPSDNTEYVPYILLQFVKGSDDEDGETKRPESTVTVRGYIALYDRDAQEGQLALLNILEKLRLDLLSRGVIGGKYELLKPFEYRFYDDIVLPYHEAEFSMNWRIQPVKRIIPELWGF